MSETSILIENLSKKYKLGLINSGTFFRDVQTLIAKKRGLPDPHGKIGDSNNDAAGDFWALRDVNLEFRQGQRVGIIGKNGAGKSTLLKLISQISSPTSGSIKIRGKVTSLLEVGTGFNGELTGRENIYLNGAILGMKRRQIDRKIDEIIDFSGIERHIDTPAKRYSSGMYVRLAFAVAAHLDSDILIADEVLAVGDASFQKKALGKMNDVSASQGRTVLFVSHQMNFISKLCQSCVILDHGSVSFVGKTHDAISRYMEQGISTDSFLKYNNVPNKPIMITGVSLIDSSGESGQQFEIFSQAFVQIKYTVNEYVQGAYIALHLFGSEEEKLIDTCDIDNDFDLFESRTPGNYCATVPIPMEVLNAGTYYVEVWTGKPSTAKDYFLTGRIQFTIFDTGSDMSKFNGTRSCLLAPKIIWDTMEE